MSCRGTCHSYLNASNHHNQYTDSEQSRIHSDMTYVQDIEHSLQWFHNMWFSTWTNGYCARCVMQTILWLFYYRGWRHFMAATQLVSISTVVFDISCNICVDIDYTRIYNMNSIYTHMSMRIGIRTHIYRYILHILTYVMHVSGCAIPSILRHFEC